MQNEDRENGTPMIRGLAIIHPHVRFGRDCAVLETIIGGNSVIRFHTVIYAGNRIGENFQTGNIPEYTKLDQECWIGPNAVFTNAKFPKSPDVKKNLAGAQVGKKAIVGENTTIHPGGRLGKRVVGAGTVVAHDVLSGTVVSGNPARHIKRIEDLLYPSHVS